MNNPVTVINRRFSYLVKTLAILALTVTYQYAQTQCNPAELQEADFVKSVGLPGGKCFDIMFKSHREVSIGILDSLISRLHFGQTTKKYEEVREIVNSEELKESIDSLE